MSRAPVCPVAPGTLSTGNETPRSCDMILPAVRASSEIYGEVETIPALRDDLKQVIEENK